MAGSNQCPGDGIRENSILIVPMLPPRWMPVSILVPFLHTQLCLSFCSSLYSRLVHWRLEHRRFFLPSVLFPGYLIDSSPRIPLFIIFSLPCYSKNLPVMHGWWAYLFCLWLISKEDCTFWCVFKLKNHHQNTSESSLWLYIKSINIHFPLPPPHPSQIKLNFLTENIFKNYFWLTSWMLQYSIVFQYFSLQMYHRR